VFREPYIRYRNGHVSRIWKPVTSPQDVQYFMVDNNNAVTLPETKSNEIRFWESLGLPDTTQNPFSEQQYFRKQPIPNNINHIPLRQTSTYVYDAVEHNLV